MTRTDRPHRTQRLAWITATLFGAVLVVAPATWQVRSWGSTRSDTLHGGSDGRPVTAVEIVGGDADVTVTPRADRQVDYRAKVSWSLRTPTIERSRLGDTLRLTPHCPGEGFWPVGGTGCSVQLAVTVPVDVPVKVTTRSGRRESAAPRRRTPTGPGRLPARTTPRPRTHRPGKRSGPRGSGLVTVHPFPPTGEETISMCMDPEVSSLMTVIAQGAARTQKTINVTSVVSG
ncbi:hypothetical protein [Streptomyces virginiae]|uniref:hypothetical protein n=1 Tax=Streptomyces virginiae TaxID=1961 RepID=UPI00368EA51B